MKRRILALVVSVIALAGCETVDTGAASRAAMNQAIRSEPPGNYFLGRRMYKVDYKVWGWVREPGRPWSTAKLVMLNEQRKFGECRLCRFGDTLRGVEQVPPRGHFEHDEPEREEIRACIHLAA